jgi:hypothetical protein
MAIYGVSMMRKNFRDSHMNAIPRDVFRLCFPFRLADAYTASLSNLQHNVNIYAFKHLFIMEFFGEKILPQIYSLTYIFNYQSKCRKAASFLFGYAAPALYDSTKTFMQ